MPRSVMWVSDRSRRPRCVRSARRPRSVSVIQAARRFTPVTWPAPSRSTVPPCATTHDAASDSFSSEAGTTAAKNSNRMARILAPPPGGQARIAVPDDFAAGERLSQGPIAVFGDQRVVEIEEAQGAHGFQLLRSGIGHARAVEPEFGKRQSLQVRNSFIGHGGVIQVQPHKMSKRRERFERLIGYARVNQIELGQIGEARQALESLFGKAVVIERQTGEARERSEMVQPPIADIGARKIEALELSKTLQLRKALIADIGIAQRQAS